jgi:Ribbon-helix-helix protein, copG family
MRYTRLYNFRIDEELDAALKALKARDGLPESEAIRRALRDYLTRRGAFRSAGKGAGMDTDFSAAWLLKGHFDLSRQPTHNTTTLQIKAHLSVALGLPKKNGLHVSNYPSGQTKKHTYWWRETDLVYGEAQFVAQISELHPILSLGVGIEKGHETGGSGLEQMDRAVWDWPRLVERIPEILSTEVPTVAASLQAPVNVAVWSKESAVEDKIAGWQTRAFSFVDGQWFERRASSVVVSPETITAHIQALDHGVDTWVILHIARDLGVREADSMSPAQAADILLRFNDIRRLLRGEI